MSAENAVDSIRKILSDDLSKKLPEIDEEESTELVTPKPVQFLVGDYTGREEIIVDNPAITIQSRNTPEGRTNQDWLVKTHSLWVDAWVVEVDIETLHRYIMRYAEAIDRLLVDESKWEHGWFNPSVNNTMYSDIFQADHRLMQGARVECEVSEIYGEKD